MKKKRLNYDEKLYEMYDAVIEAFDKYKIRIYAQGGTLIGLKRDGGVIPWDDDLDFHVKWPRFIKHKEEILKEISNKGYLVSHYWSRKSSHGFVQVFQKEPVSFWMNGFKRKAYPQIDIMPVVNAEYNLDIDEIKNPENRDVYKNNLKNWTEVSDNWVRYDGWFGVMGKTMKLEDENVVVSGRKFYIPTNYEEVLETQFGENWNRRPKFAKAHYFAWWGGIVWWRLNNYAWKKKKQMDQEDK